MEICYRQGFPFEVGGTLNQGFPFSPLMSTFVFSPKHKGAEYRSLVVEMIGSD